MRVSCFRADTLICSLERRFPSGPEGGRKRRRIKKTKRLKENNGNNKPAAASAAGTGAPCERAVLVAVVRDNQDPRQAEEFLDELEFLAETADIRAVRRFTQRLPREGGGGWRRGRDRRCRRCVHIAPGSSSGRAGAQC